MTHPDRIVPENSALASEDDITHMDAAAQVPTETDFAPRPPDVPLAEAAESDAIAGIRLGGYRLLETLGEGGMGKVYRAEDDTLNRVVAVKIMRPEIARNPQSLDRFLREARAAAAVKSDHIVTVYQVGYEQGVPYLAMEFLQGEVLEGRAKREKCLAIEDVTRIGRDVARGLAAAHGRGLIHRDIKPANVWLEPLQEGGFRAKLLDFGLARDSSSEEHITGVGQIVGTPSYMSPEQANGDPVDTRTDLFSLGVLLYRLVTGTLPFRGDSTMAVLTSLATQDPIPPSRLRRDLPQNLSQLILQLLEKDRDHRPASAAEVAAQLAPVPSQTVIEVEPLPTGIESTNFEFDVSAEATTNTVTSETTSPRTRASGRWVLPSICVLSGLLLTAGTVKLGAYIVEVKSARGTLVIESDDPTVEVVVKKDGAVIKDRTRDRELDLRVGDYTIEVADNKDGLRLNTSSFTIERDGKAYVRVRLEKPKPNIVAKEGLSTLPPVFVPACDDGPSPLDNLDASKIAASEKFEWQPKELIAVVGTPTQGEADPKAGIISIASANRFITWNLNPNSLQRWDFDGPEPKSLPIKQAAFGRGMTILPDGRVVGLTKGTNNLSVFDPSKVDAKVPVEIKGDFKYLWNSAVSRSGRWLSVALHPGPPETRNAKLFDLNITPPRFVAELGTGALNTAINNSQFAPGEQFLVTLRADALAVIWDIRGPKPKSAADILGCTAAHFAVDQTSLVAGFQDGKVKLFDYSTGEFKETVSMQPFTRPVYGAILLPGGKTVMACDDEGHIKFLKVPTGDVEREWKWPGFAVLSLSNDGRHVFTQNANGTGYVLRLRERTPSPLEKLVPTKIPDAENVDYLPEETVAVFGTHERRTWSGPFGLVGGLGYSPDGKHLVAADFGNLYVYDAASMKLKFRQGAPPFVDSARAFAFSADGRTLYCSKASTWDLSRDQIKQIIDPSLDKSHGITKATSSDGKLLAFGTHVGESGIIDLSQKNAPIVFNWTVSGHCMEMCFSPDSKWLIAVEKGLGYRIFRFSDGKWSENALIKTAGNRVTYSFAEKRKLAVLLGGGVPIPVDLSVEQAKELNPFPNYDNIVDFTFDSTGEKWAATRHDYYKSGAAELVLGEWRGTELRETKRIPLPHVGYVAYAPDGKSVATHGYDNSVHVWDLTQDTPAEKFKSDPEVNHISISPDGKTVASICYDGQLTLWDWPEGLPRRKQTVKTKHSSVYAVWINSTRLLTASLPGLNIPYGPLEFTLWDITPEGLKERSAFSAATPSVWQLSVSTDGTRLVHSDTLWDLTASPPTQLGAFKELVKNPDALDFSADGKHLFASSNGQLLLLDAAKTDAPALATARAPAGLKSVKCSPDGSFVTLHSGAQIIRWERNGKNLVEKLRYTNSSDGKVLLGYHLTTAAFNPDGTKSYISIGNGITECDARTGVALRMWAMPGVSYPTVSKDGRFLFCANANGTGYVIRLQGAAIRETK